MIASPNVLIVHNRQRNRRISTKHLREIIRVLLVENLLLNEFEIGISIINEAAMTRMNEGFLRHMGSTDVITFDYKDESRPKCLAGEIFVCLDEALIQAPRFRKTWQTELVRYVVHGVLHLCGFDDKTAGARRKMKREEDRLMRHLAIRFNLDELQAVPRRARNIAR
jgi:probable rRNA maturation factor